MLAFTKRLRSVAYIAIGVLMLTLGQSTTVQGCHGGRGGMSGGYPGSGNSYGTGSQNYSSPQQSQTSSPTASLNNPATVLAYEGDLNLTSKQVQALERMANSGKQHAALVLTAAQRRQLADLVGTARKSGSTGISYSPGFGASSIVGSP